MDKKIDKLIGYFANSEKRATIYNKCMLKLNKEFDNTSTVLCMLVAYFVCEFCENCNECKGSEQERWLKGL